MDCGASGIQARHSRIGKDAGERRSPLHFIRVDLSNPTASVQRHDGRV
jgi:hypothetical protein